MNLCDITYVKRLMARYQTGTKKSFGQNFLINKEIPESIAEASYSYHLTKSKKKSLAVEIGPGIGCLTYELASAYDKVVAIEIDSTLLPILEETLGEFDNVEVINNDFLKMDLEEFFSAYAEEYNISVCANLPYYITTPIIMALLERARGYLTSITVMVQKEVADRLCATTKKGDYGAITASIAYYGEAKKLFKVSAGCFLPAPKVDSAVIRIDLYDEPKYKPKNEKLFRNTIKAAFEMRRKTLLNALNGKLGFTKEEIRAALLEMGLDENIRGERLSTEEFVKLSDILAG
jgi:16S rRNA (adenine1518-N6/adenine1519-N6)-dimethyltransferase